MSERAIETLGLTKWFTSQLAVDELSLSLPHGRVFGLVGPNGAGKTTLIKMLLGLIKPTAGQGAIFGRDIGDPSGAVRQHVGFIVNTQSLYPDLRADDVLRLCAGVYPDWDRERCRKLKTTFDLPWNRRVRAFSKGMRTQLALLIALSLRPKLLLLDEPTSGLDPVVKQVILQLLMQEVAGGDTTLFFSTHHVSELERMADDIGFMLDGKLIVNQSLEELKASSRKIQAVLPEELPADIRQMPDILKLEEHGRVSTLVVHGDWQAVLDKISGLQPIHLELLDVGLEELFVCTAYREGYRYEPVELA